MVVYKLPKGSAYKIAKVDYAHVLYKSEIVKQSLEPKFDPVNHLAFLQSIPQLSFLFSLCYAWLTLVPLTTSL